MDPQLASKGQLQLPKFSGEDTRILAECRRESFYFRSLPFAGVLSAGAIYAVKAGYLQSNARFGVVPKVLGAVLIGYVAGKLSYAKTCSEKFINSPRSDVGAALRRNKGLKGLDTGFDSRDDSGFVSDRQAEKLGEQATSLNIREAVAPSSFSDSYTPPLDMDASLPSSSAAAPELQKSVSYDELRQQNREEYEISRRRPVIAETNPEPRPSRSPAFKETAAQSPKNKYGDAMEG